MQRSALLRLINQRYWPRSARLACCHGYSTSAASEPALKEESKRGKRLVIDSRTPSLQDFLAKHQPAIPIDPALVRPESVPYLDVSNNWGKGRKFYIEVYGCQMNVNDTEILNAILADAGYERTLEMNDADIVFLITCAIRDNAEAKIWDRLKYLRHFRTKINVDRPPLVGLLGCMAERLKTKLLEEDRLVDIVCGPDGYRSIPRLISLAENGYDNGVANVMLSADETYADVMPMRLDEDKVSGWVSIMRGCNNMCSFCIVPFTRGNERSRPIDTIIDEVRHLSDQGVKEVTLLGQNVNSYRDLSESNYFTDGTDSAGATLSNAGFRTIYKRKDGGRRFTELLDRVSRVNPEMRIRFTSPHPKDFPTDLLYLIAERPNLCRSIHLPIQSGSSTVLERMRRGYTREAYLELVNDMRRIIPDVWISSDFITGFCGETEAEHKDTVSLMEQVEYDMAYMFAYSMREKTHAHRRYADDVPEADKSRRLNEIIHTFHKSASTKNQKLIGTKQLVLVDSDRPTTKRGVESRLSGRTDGGHKVFVTGDDPATCKGDYVEVQIEQTTSASLRGRLLGKSSIHQYNQTRMYSQQTERSTVRSYYRAFLKAGDAAVSGNAKRKREIHRRIREGFQRYLSETDPAKRVDLDLRSRNTLSFLEIAGQRRGIEHRVIRNLCDMQSLQRGYDVRPPFYNVKMKDSLRQMHDNSKNDVLLLVSMLNNDLQMCL